MNLAVAHRPAALRKGISMDDPVLLLVILDFVFIASLAKIFFRKDGVMNARWWSVSLPIGVIPLFLTVSRIFGFPSLLPDGWLRTTQLVAGVCIAASIALISMTLGTHRVPIALWHQTDDAPRHVVTWGAYRLIRHPFYTGYLLAFAGAFACFPHAVTLVLFLYEAVMLNAVAAKEERKLCASAFGAEYQEYLSRTNRFLPLRMTRPPGAVPSPTDQEFVS
ncbi:methyltransferase family protein [Streptomyces sp. NPDC056704]|uniref:methyltransferase family protein n=1 Tax=Streptomyces sp. NPDC056704 TaxID=3345917 RepID=UPI00369CBDC9